MSKARPTFESPVYEVWMNRVDEALDFKVGQSSSDLPDKSWMDWYEQGLSPGAAATLALEDEDL